MKKIKRVFAWMMILMMTFSNVPMSEIHQVQAKKKTIKAKSITLNKKIYTLKKGKKIKLKAKILPKKATQKKVVWTSSKKKIATVSKSGVVKAKKNGRVTITARIKGTKKKAVCKIIVGTPVSSVKFSVKSKNLYKGKYYTLKAKISPSKATTKSVSYASSNKKIASVNSSGKVKALSAGTAKITATTKDGTGKKASYTVRVLNPEKPNNTTVYAEKITVPEEEKNKVLENGESFQIHATMFPSNTTNKKLKYSTSDSRIATVDDNGKVTAQNVTGTAVITISSGDGKAKTQFTVKVKERYIAASQIELNKKNLLFYSNSAPEQLTVAVKPENATNKNVIWTSSDEKIAKVSDHGVVTPVAKEGQAKITATLIDGKATHKAVCEVTIVSGVQVTSAQQLQNVLEDDDTYDAIYFESEEEQDIVLPAQEDEKKFEDTKLQINAPKATVTNHIKFKEIKILNISQDTYIEYANNTLTIAAKKSHIIIKEGAEVELKIDEQVDEIKVDKYGDIKNVVIKSEGKITLQGSPSQKAIPVTVDAKAKIYTAYRLTIVANEKAVLILKSGSEGTSVTTKNEKNTPSVSGLGSITVQIQDGENVDEKIVLADQTDEEVGAVTVPALNGMVTTSKGESLQNVKVFLVAYSKDFKIADFTSNDAIKSTETKEDGEYKISSVKAGNYYLIFQKEGYYDTVQTCLVANTESEVTNPTVILTSHDEETEKGSVSGRIIDSVTGSALKGMTVRIRDGQNNITGDLAADEILTDADGKYKFEDLKPGIYTVQIVDLRDQEQRYISTYFNVYIEAGKESSDNGTGVSPVIDDDQIRFVLTWGNEASGAPRDLDSHLIGPKKGSGQFHTYFSEKTYAEDEIKYADLDLDDTSWEGPETTTIYKKTSGIYYFLVHDYTNCESDTSDALSSSQAKVEVYSGSRLVQSYYVPNKSGTQWSVCAYNADTGEITSINEMGYEAESEDVGSNLVYGDLRITGVETNDYVKAATIYGGKIHLKIATEDLKNHLNDIKPEIKLSSAEYKIYYDQDQDQSYIVLSDKKGLERKYYISYEVDYGNKIVSAFKTNDNVTSYDIYQEENEIYLYMKDTDISKDSVRNKIEPEIHQEGIDYKIQEIDGDYYFVLTDEDQSVRTYRLFVYNDYTDLNIESITSSDNRVTKAEVEDDENNIYIYGSEDNLEKIKNVLTFSFGPDVKSNTGIQGNEEDGYTITVIGDYGERTYDIKYYFDYGDLCIEKVESKDDNVISVSYIDYDKIEIDLYDTELSENLIKEYLTFYYGTNTTSGSLKKVGEEYQYVITDSNTGKIRTYQIHIYAYFSEKYSIQEIKIADGDLDYQIWGDEIELSGEEADFESIKDRLQFELGESVESTYYEKTNDGQYYIVLKCKNNIIRKFKILYYQL